MTVLSGEVVEPPPSQHAVGHWAPILWTVGGTTGFAAALTMLDVSPASSLWFLGVQLLSTVVPGTIVWRRTCGRTGDLFEDIVLGTILGHVLSLLAYIVLRPLDLPQLLWMMPVLVLAIAWLVPSGETQPRSGYARGAWPVWMPGALAALVLYLLYWAVHVQDANPVSTGAENRQGTDFPFLLGLAGETKHHIPPQFPFVIGEPLDYHWFFFADAASVHWRSGIDLDLLVFRLLPLWFLVVTVLAFWCVARRIVGDSVVALCATVIAVVAGNVIVPGWATFSDLVIAAPSLLNPFNWAESPTQGYGMMLSVPLVLLLVECVRRGSASFTRARAVVMVMLAAAVVGAKAVFLPVIGGGLLAVVLVSVVRRPINRRALVLGVAGLLILLLGQLTLYGGRGQGLTVGPQRTLARIAGSLDLSAEPLGIGVALAVAGLLLGLWFGPYLAAAATVRSRDPGVVFLLGAALSSVVAAGALTHPGLSQMYFVRAGLPWLSVLAAVVLVPVLRRRSKVAGIALLSGILADLVLLLVTVKPSEMADLSLQGVLLVLTIAGFAAAALVGVILARTSNLIRGAAPLACLFVLGLGFGDLVTQAAVPFSASEHGDEGIVPDGGIAAARYIRDNAADDDLVATNAHCALPDRATCDTRHHWIAAWTERRVLVEGWAYSAKANAGADDMVTAVTGEFWDRRRLALNDRLFRQANEEALDALLGEYPVRWLVVDLRYPHDIADLEHLLAEHRRFGDTVVLRVGADEVSENLSSRP